MDWFMFRMTMEKKDAAVLPDLGDYWSGRHATMAIENRSQVHLPVTKRHRISRIYSLPCIAISPLLLMGMSPTKAEENNIQVLNPAQIEDTIFTERRELMASEIERQVRKSGYRNRRRLRPIIDAIRTTPRHLFVPEDIKAKAYEHHPLPIGYGQTISDPYIVAIMTYVLHLEPGDKVLEIGTGSGYQAAILSPLVNKVFTIEIVEPLAERSSKLLQYLDYQNVVVRSGDGYQGWPAEAPFDAIIVTAGASHVPPALLDQLKPGGKMVIPVGEKFWEENLTLIEKNRNRTFVKKHLGWVMFVDFTGEITQQKLPRGNR
jgi:protein-L-isoaspartate(D-aspartate) O-methyltransferase